ncbi:alpha/beta-hydrolase [Dacryopinax primogenitus]|uniref:Alpha/beta-hydrolase n=1 Tax=Dacryopinax primogenitus (strain DJM 731) TaxID=1858805 RepID=M5GEU4_DACPD|nr:alpha/beta-hydrolase [Dacryopinax primogenitus]EJU05682.1 alpha/beta-hydrolase [Dacryopinax primogenitus]
MAYLAKPSGDHCFQAVKHEGTPTGVTEEIGGIKCYVGYPPDKKTDKIVMFFCDVYGPWYLNNQLLIDFFALRGYLVVAPDYFQGDQLEELSKNPDFDRKKWIDAHVPSSQSIVVNFTAAIKEKYGTKKVGCVGYCFGGQHVMKSLTKGDAIAGAFVHPAFIKEKDFEEMKQGAAFFSCAETDGTFPAELRHKAEAIVQANKLNYHFQLFSGVTHGFAIRGDPKDENQRWAKEQSAWGISGWIDRFLQ